MTDARNFTLPLPILGEQMLSIDDVAQKLGCSHSTIYKWLDSRHRNFPQPIKWLGRNFWSEAAIDAWLSNVLQLSDPAPAPTSPDHRETSE